MKFPIISLPLLLLFLAACSSLPAPLPVTTPSISAPSAAVPACGEVSDLEPNPDFDGVALAHAGPVWFSAFGRVQSGKAIVAGFTPGRPTKVLIHPDPSNRELAYIKGADCAIGKPLRFCYLMGDCGFEAKTVSESDLGRMGDDTITIDPRRPGDLVGYMLFPRPGKYRVWVSQGGREVGAVVLQVQ